jgi:hypothetical protein
MLYSSEAVVVLSNEPFHLVEIFKVFKDTVLEHSVELVFNTSQHSSRFETVHAALGKIGFPVDGVEIEKGKSVKNFANTSVDLSGLKVGVNLHGVVARHFLCNGIEPGIRTFKSKGRWE